MRERTLLLKLDPSISTQLSTTPFSLNIKLSISESFYTNAMSFFFYSSPNLGSIGRSTKCWPSSVSSSDVSKASIICLKGHRVIYFVIHNLRISGKFCFQVISGLGQKKLGIYLQIAVFLFTN